MTDYIDREKLLAEIKVAEAEVKARDAAVPTLATISAKQTISSLIKIIEDVSVEDVSPVVHGRWEGRQKDECSVCRNYTKRRYFENFCPYCGAKMDKEVGK